MAITASTLASRRANFVSGTRFVLADAALNAELGEDNAARLRSVLGERLVAAGFRRDSAGVGEATFRIIGQLSPSERLAAIGSGNLPARVAGLISEETSRLATTARLVNIHGADAAGAVNSAVPGGLVRERGSPSRSLSGASILREISGSAAAAREALVTAASETARSLGMTWALNNREVLALGPEGIRAFAAVNVSQHGYKHLRDAGFTAPETVIVAKYFKHIGVKDGDKVSAELHQGVDKLAGDGPDSNERRTRIRREILDIIRDPGDRSPQAQERRLQAHERLRDIAGTSPRHQEGLREIENTLRLQRANELGATAAAQTDQTRARADADAFNQPAPTAKVEAKPDPAATTSPQIAAAKPKQPAPTT